MRWCSVFQPLPKAMLLTREVLIWLIGVSGVGDQRLCCGVLSTSILHGKVLGIGKCDGSTESTSSAWQGVGNQQVCYGVLIPSIQPSCVHLLVFRRTPLQRATCTAPVSGLRLYWTCVMRNLTTPLRLSCSLWVGFTAIDSLWVGCVAGLLNAARHARSQSSTLNSGCCNATLACSEQPASQGLIRSLAGWPYAKSRLHGFRTVCGGKVGRLCCTRCVKDSIITGQLQVSAPNWHFKHVQT